MAMIAAVGDCNDVEADGGVDWSRWDPPAAVMELG
jgi:hypothetical protein